MAIVLLIIGLALLTAGAEILVRGASGLARSVGLPSLVIGLTVVAFGTSAPEMAVSVKASLAGQADIALGNVVGSNIFNVLFILGISALVVPLAASKQLVRLDVPVMSIASGLLWLIAFDGSIGRVEGACLCAGIVIYTALLVYLGRRNARESPSPGIENEPQERKPTSLLRAGLFVVVGLAMLVLGARWLVTGAVDLARMLGVSELMIGLTIVAAGTSMPEVATSVVASIRGERDIAIGNVVGSNIFNILAVLGLSAVAAPDGVAVVSSALRFDIPVMVAVAFACLPVFFTGGRISRWEGALFLGYYAAYLAVLFMAAVRHASLASFSNTMLWFAIPLTALGIAISVLCWVRKRRESLLSVPQLSSVSAAPRQRHTPKVELTSVLDDLDAVVEGLNGRPVTLRQLEHALRGRGAAVLILILSVPFILPIPVPLLATICGVPMVVMGLRMMTTNDGRLPHFAHRHELSSNMFRRIAKGLRKLLKPVAFLYRPRFGVMFWPLAWRLTGLSIFLAAFMLSLPIPIPFANMIPAIGLIHLAAGLIQRDGLAILVGHAFTLGAYLYLYFIWDTAIEILSKLIL